MAQVAPLIRVFFSSTFADFQQERDVLQARVFPTIRRYCLEQGARFLPIDLRWGIAEEASEKQYVVRACMEEVARCQRTSPNFNFVALIGDRYGSSLFPEEIPEGDFVALSHALSKKNRTLAERWYALDENGKPPVYVLKPRDRAWKRDERVLHQALIDACAHADISPKTRLAFTTSVTEQEIQAGIFEGNPLARPIIMRRYIKGRFIPQTFSERTRSGSEKLANLEQRLRDTYTADFGAYETQISAWTRKISDQSLDAFALQIERALKERVDFALEHEGGSAQGLRYWSFAQDRLSHFTGQTDARQRIETYLSAATRTPLIVTGESGIGKTSLLLKVTDETQKQHTNTESLWYFIGGSTAIATAPDLIEDIERKLLERYPHSDKLTIPETPAERSSRLPDFLALATKERPLILVVDALDQLQGKDLTRWIPETLPPNAHLVISILPGADADQLRARLPEDAWLTVQPLPVEEAGEALDRWLDDSHRTLTGDQRQAIMRYYEKHPNPLGLRVISEMAKRWTSHDTEIPALQPTVPALIEDLLTSLEKPERHGRLLVEHSLGLIASGKQGLTEDEILAVISRDADLVKTITHTHPDMPQTTQLPAVLWARVYSDLEWALTERDVDRSRVLTFYHRQVHEAVRSRYLTGAKQRDWRGRLARYFERQVDQAPYLVNTADRPRAIVNERMVSELLFQQVGGGLYDDARRTIFDAEFLQARIQIARTGQALADLDDILNRDAQITHLRDVLDLSQPVLDLLPQELPNQIWGRSQQLYQQMRSWASWDDPHMRLESYTLRKPAQDGAESGHGKAVTTCAFSPDGSRALSSSRDSTVRIWNLENLRSQDAPVTSVVLKGHADAIQACVFDPTGTYIASGSDDATVKLWDSSGHLLHTFDDHTGGILCCAFSPGGQFLASASVDRTVRVYDRDTYLLKHYFKGHEKDVNKCVFSPDGALLATASSDGTLCVWRLADERALVLKGHTAAVLSCLFTPDGKRVISASADSTLRVWNLESADASGIVLPEHTLAKHSGRVNDCALNPVQLNLLLSAGEDGWFRIWDINAGVQRYEHNGRSNGIRQCAFTPDGKAAIGASWGNKLLVWDWATGQSHILSGHVFGLNALAISPDGTLAMSGSEDKTIHLWDIQDPKSYKLRAVLGQQADIIRACAVSADGSLAVRGTAGGWMELEDTRTHRSIYRWQAHAECVRGCAISPDNRLILSGSEDKVLRLWNSGTADYQEYVDHTSQIRFCAFSPDGAEMLSAGGEHGVDTIIRLWKIGEPKPIQKYNEGGAQNEVVIDCCFSPDDSVIYSASYDNSILRWVKDSGEYSTVVKGPTSAPGLIRTIGMNRNGTRLAYGGKDGPITVCEIPSGQTVCELPAHKTYVNTCRFTPDDHYVISCSSDSTVQVWELPADADERQAPTITWRGNNETLVCMAYDPDHGQIFVAEDDAFHTLSLVNLPTRLPALVAASSDTWQAERGG